MKKCSKCGIEKDEASFCKGFRFKDGIKGSCKDCDSLYQKKWYKTNAEKVSIFGKNLRNDPEFIIKEKIRRKNYINSFSKEDWKRKVSKDSKNVIYNLKDSYIAKELKIPVKDLREYPELIEAKRFHILIYRVVKENQCQE